MEAYDAIMTRRSVPRAEGPAPDRAQIERLLDAAVRAPNHHLTQPWRFVVLTGDALRELGDVWAAGARREGKDPESVRAKPRRAPVVICVIARPKGHLRRVSDVEEHHAVGAALQNILLSAHAAGLAAMLRTGPAAHIPEVRRHLGVGDDELVAGFVYVGHPPRGDERPMTTRIPARRLTEWRGWQ
ncbi:MAG TPA: nitroreductase [Actinomycetota bacterium]|nr:nitroreductase [Actinomycetota bacterium]